MNIAPSMVQTAMHTITATRGVGSRSMTTRVMARNLTTTEVAGMHTMLVISSARITENQVCDRKALNLHQDFLLGKDQ